MSRQILGAPVLAACLAAFLVLGTGCASGAHYVDDQGRTLRVDGQGRPIVPGGSSAAADPMTTALPQGTISTTPFDAAPPTRAGDDLPAFDDPFMPSAGGSPDPVVAGGTPDEPYRGAGYEAAGSPDMDPLMPSAPTGPSARTPSTPPVAAGSPDMPSGASAPKGTTAKPNRRKLPPAGNVGSSADLGKPPGG